MAGEELRNILFINKIEIKSLAKQLGMSPQSLSQMFTANDVKSGLLEKIAEVLNKDMTFFYPVPETTVNTIHHVRQGNNSQLVGTGSASMDNTEVISRLMDELSALRKQNEKLMEKLLAQ